MEFTPADASDILNQIQQGQWKWLKVKRFVPETYADLQERYGALEKHHAEETGRMIDVIRGLCRALESIQGSGDTLKA